MRTKNFFGGPRRLWLAAGATCLLLALGYKGNAEELVPLNIKVPSPTFVGTPSDRPEDSEVEKPSDTRPPLMVPPGVRNLALHKPVTTGDTNKLAEDLAKITDGDKDSGEESVLLLRKGPQWVQIDLGAPEEIYAIFIWHGFDEPKVYHAVVVQVGDDAKFTHNVRTLFNNDRKNLDNLGAGTNREYFESNQGKLIVGKGTVARYVRLYSCGSTASHLNEYTEVEVYGRPPK